MYYLIKITFNIKAKQKFSFIKFKNKLEVFVG